MSSYRAAVLGVGRLGAQHARLLAASSRFDLVGVHDADPDRGRAVAERVGCRPFDDARALAREADAVVIAVPTAAHREVAELALEEGCHVLVEKPLARDVEEADALLAVAEARGLLLGVGHSERFNGLLLAVDGLIERPGFIESLRMAPFQPRGTDVTVVLDLMIHDIDLVLALADSPLADVHAVGVPVLTTSIDIANARLVFESGTVANITASRVSPKPLRQLRLFQPSGYFSLDLAAGRGEIASVRGGAPEGATFEQLAERRRVEALPGEPLARELDEFAEAIVGRPSRLARGPAGRQALAVAARITREIEEFAHVVAQDP